MDDFKLSASLKGHDDDVRGVAFAKSRSILSASRDGTVRRWLPQMPLHCLYDESILLNAPAFMNSITFIPASTEHPAGLAVAGGKEAIIQVRSPESTPDSDPERMLLGHQSNVCALDVCTDQRKPYIVSGSWDSSAMLWDLDRGESTVTFDGHNGSVWTVLAYDHGKVITGCADHLLRVFSTAGKLLNTLKGNTDVVRALCKIPSSSNVSADFASAGNDSIIRLWTLEGKEVAQLHGHENFVYSLASLPTGELVSSGEDRTVRVWRASECIQTITHPAISVWAVAACPESGDIATGASDKLVRVFSRSEERQAEEPAIKAFEDSVRSSSIPQQTVPDINKDQLPGPDFLKRKSGTKEGQVQMIREPNGNVSAHQWSHLAQQWISVGTVVDSTGSSGRKQQYLGHEYDYVFDVDIEDGKPPLKLPYSLSQNPYEVAEKFIADNKLPVSYLGQVAEFIVRNTQGVTVGGQQASATPNGSIAQPRTKVLPQRDYLTITAANFALICRKTQELNSQLLCDGRKDLSLSPSDIQLLPDFTRHLEAAVSKPTSSDILDAGAHLAIKIVTAWPQQQRIPGLDLLRGLCAASTSLSSNHDILAIVQNSGAFAPALKSNELPNPNMTMLAIRAFANLFAHLPGRTLATSGFQTIHKLVSPQMQPAAGTVNRNLHIASVTLYINYAVLLINPEEIQGIGPAESANRAQTLLRDLSSLLGNTKVVDTETIYRALVAVGTLVRVPGAKAGDHAVDDLNDNAKKASSRAKEPRIRGLFEEMTG